MKIAVTHLTRMQRGYICVAGVDIDTGKHVRPVVSGRRLESALSARHGGPFDMATVVDPGRITHVPSPPETEDHEFFPRFARRSKDIEPQLFWEMLQHLARPSLHALFGPDLRRAGRERLIVEERRGVASLGCLEPRGRPALVQETRPDGTPSLRLRFTDGQFSLCLSVTDLRLWEDDHQTPRQALVRDIARRLASGVPCLLGVGLTRPFAPTADLEPVHWLQVNNLHLSDDPCWRLKDTPPGTLRTEASRPITDDDPLEDLPF
ncbi:MAG: hypothetical protein IT429_20965 [Gemmataceae bacterium]|nr:hypothetical protein [Gemmataceae bacterium]